MKTSSQLRVSLVLTTVMVALFAVSSASLYKVDSIRSETRQQDVLYISSAKALKRLSLGYSGLMADIYWTRAVQYFGWKHKHREMDYHLLYPLLDITTELDPQLIAAYRFGAPFIAQPPPNGAGEPDKAVDLIERGIKHNPNEWRLYYELGFLQAMERHDYVAAADAFNRGSQVPGAHPFLKILAAAMAQHGGDFQTARMLWQTTMQTAEEPMIKQNAERHLRALEVDQVVPQLEQLAQAYRQKTGNQPTSFLQLVSAGYLRRIPVDPLGHPYKLRSDGRVEVQDPDALPFIKQGLPPDYKPALKSVPELKM
jgi:hypothetical protein